MKKSLLFSLVLLLAGFATAVVLLTSGNDTIKTESEKPQVLSMTASVSIPERMTFAGEEILFDRYDKRERMDRELNSFTYFHSTTMLLIKRANRIFPIIEPILKREGVPDDMKYLAVIESSLDHRAVSPAGAVGLWQFIQSAGRENGLEIRTDVDERYNIEKSTVAACRYLKNAHRRYESWSAASMSYNGGQGRITTELRDQKADDALDLWLVEETTRYYYRMLAIKQIFEQPQQYGFIIKPEHLYKPMEFKKVNVTSTLPDLVSFAQQNKITYAQLKDFNSWLRTDKLNNASGKTYTILIPTEEDLYYKKGSEPKVHNPAWVID
ncbi:MAG: lytic transglycosylase domain-containing protein [Fermentimonas sp.]|nr:lytic transglycosylase domain-containing protein [Fermentimonas sp.]MDD4697887.1 lytic transglycosylase domain-containing protein [Fermentimonas sp.]